MTFDIHKHIPHRMLLQTARDVRFDAILFLILCS